MYRYSIILLLTLLATACAGPAGEGELWYHRGQGTLFQIRGDKVERFYSHATDPNSSYYGFYTFGRERVHRFDGLLAIETHLHIKSLGGVFHGGGEFKVLPFQEFVPFHTVRLELYRPTGEAWSYLDVQFANDVTGLSKDDILEGWKSNPPSPSERWGGDALLPVSDERFRSIVGEQTLSRDTLPTAITDPIMAVYTFELALFAEDTELATEILESHRGLLENSPIEFYRRAVPFMEKNLWRERQRRNGNAVGDRVTALSQTRDEGGASVAVDGKAMQEIVHSLTLDSLFAGRFVPLLPPRQPDGVPSFLGIQTLAKHRRVLAEFGFLNGDPEPGIRDLLQWSTLAAIMMSEHEYDIVNLIGMAVSSIQSASLQTILINLDDPGVIEEHLPQFLEIHAFQVAQKTGIEYDDLLESAWDPKYRDYRVQHVSEIHTRRRVTNATQARAIAGAAVRHHQLSTGALPTTPIESLALLPGGLPIDPFSGVPLRAAEYDEGLRLYSIGPDETDNGGAISYDPSNGTISPGDIVLDLPRTPLYPARVGEPLPRTRAEILARFPNNLPADPFADTRGRPYTISDSNPAEVYSFGPDVDEPRLFDWNPSAPGGGQRVEKSPPPPPEAPYDPTNGVISKGDIRLRRN